MHLKDIKLDTRKIRSALVVELLFSRTGIIPAFFSFLAVFWFISGGQFVSAGVCVFAFIFCLYSIKNTVEDDRRQIQQLIADLRKFESLDYSEACAKAGEGSVPVARALAHTREFPTAPAGDRYRYFERKEIVFLVEETADGRARFVFQSHVNS